MSIPQKKTLEAEHKLAVASLAQASQDDFLQAGIFRVCACCSIFFICVAMPPAKRRPNFREGELKICVVLDVEGYRDQTLERIVIMTTDTIEEIRGKIHRQGEIPVEASGILYKRMRHGFLRPLNDTLLVRNYRLRDGTTFVLSDAE